MSRSVADDIAAIGRLPAVEKILEVVSQTTGMRFAAVARVTGTTWTACAVRDGIDFGLAPGDEPVLETTICNEIRQHHQPVVFGQASTHPKFARHSTPKMYGFESYISVPVLRRNGDFFGTLCAIDPAAADLDDPRILHTLELFAELISAQLDTDDEHAHTQHALLAAQDVAKLREQFIAVLGHDLRNPLQVLSLYTGLLKDQAWDAAWRQRIADMQHSCDRMSELIANILDFARGRLGEGIQISPCPVTDLGEALTRVVAEVQATHPASIIECELAIAAPVVCDRARILQLFANLLVNAVTHGASDQPVRVQGGLLQGSLEVSVDNGGPAIAQERLQHLFEPFARGEQGRSVSGLGLGLYIARQIAQAHGGTLDVESSETHRTSFVFRLPMGGVDIGGVDMGDRSAGSAADPGPPPASREVQSRNAFADVAARCAR